MGLISGLAAFATARPPVFTVTAPGGTAVRLAVEAELRMRGWRRASSPVAGSVLVVCGEPGPALGQAIERVWDEIPNPRTRVQAHTPDPDRISLLMDRAVRELADLPAQRADAAARTAEGPAGPAVPEEHTGGGHTHDEHGGEGQDNGGHGGDGHGGGHEHHGGEVAGLKMADRGPDRDGLELDRLHAQLGPALGDWPAGLIVRVVLQGDVVQRAEAEVVDGAGGGSFWDEPWLAARGGARVSRGTAERRRAASHLDGLGRLLAVAGWEQVAGQARWLRDGLLADLPAERLAARFERLSGAVLRSRTLRWMLCGLGPVEAPVPSARFEGDAVARLHALLADTRKAMGLLGESAPVDPAEDGPRGGPGAALVSLLPGLLTGADLAAARLIVASLDPDPDQPAVAAAHA